MTLRKKLSSSPWDRFPSLCELFTGALEESTRLEKSALQNYIIKISEASLRKV